MDTVVNSSFYLKALFDTGCLCFSAFSDNLVKQKKLPRIPIERRDLKLAKNDEKERSINFITKVEIDIDGRKETIYGYVIKDLAYDAILGKPWMEKNDVVYLAKKRAIRFGSTRQGLLVRESGWYNSRAPNEVQQRVSCVKSGTAVMVIGSVFSAYVKRLRLRNQA
jgi:hypothetical protein